MDVYEKHAVGFKSFMKHYIVRVVCCVLSGPYVSNPQKLCRHSLIAFMLWFIQISFASLVIIFVLHKLYAFFKDTLTVPKIKDMVKRPQQKYETLFRELRNRGQDFAVNDETNSNTNANANAVAMKNELKRYLMDLNSNQSQPQPQPQYPQPQSDFIELGSTFN